MKIDDPGDIIIEMHSEPEKDIDFICWGPFDDAYEPCVLDLTADKVVDCSYSIYAYETVSVLSTSTGEYYILLITNYSDDACNIIFSQTGGDGTTDCTILPPEASSNSPVCIGYDIELFAVSVINAEYEWYGPDGFYSDLQNPVIYGAGIENMGSYTCKIHIGSQTNSTNIVVEVVNPPTAVIDGFEEICLGDEAVISFELTGAPPWKIYYTDGNETFSVITDNYLTFDTVSPTSSTTYTLSYLEDEVCSGNELTGSAVVIIHPDIQIRDTDTECNEANTHYTVTFEIFGGDPDSYYVLPEGGSITPDPPYIYTSELIPESTPFNYSAQDDYGCMEATTGGIQSCQCPASAEISGEFSICKEESAVLEIVLIGFLPWHVTYTQNNANPQDLIIYESPYYLEVSPDVTTAYAITYVEDIYCSGTGKGDANVLILPSPDTDFSFSPTCQGDTTFFTDLSTIGGGEITGWLWDFDDGGSSSILRNPQYKYSATGTYMVELTATSDLGCSESTVRTVSVNEVPDVTVCNDTAIYFQTSAFLTGTVEGGSGHYAYSWTPAYLVLEPFDISTETVSLEMDNDFVLYGTDVETGCVSSDTVNVHISGAPLQISVSADPPILCIGGFSQLDVNTIGGVEPFEYHWTSDPPGFVFNIPDPIVNPLETTVFTVVVSDGFSSIEDEVKINVYPIPIVDAGPDQSIPDGWSAELECDITGGSNPFVYQWSPSELLIHPDSSETSTVPLTAPALFNINVTDRWGL